MTFLNLSVVFIVSTFVGVAITIATYHQLIKLFQLPFNKKTVKLFQGASESDKAIKILLDKIRDRQLMGGVVIAFFISTLMPTQAVGYSVIAGLAGAILAAVIPIVLLVAASKEKMYFANLISR